MQPSRRLIDDELRQLCAPCLGRHLHGVPRAAERRSVAKIEIVEIFDARPLEEGRRDDIDALGYLGSSIPYDLAAQQPSSSPVAGQADAERHRAGVIGLMVIDLRIHGHRIELCRARVSFVEAGTRDRQVEHLEALCSERAREAPVAANRILARNPPLFVRDRSQGDVGRRVKQAVVRLDAIARRKNIRQVCAHLSRDDDRAASAELRPGLFREFAVGASADRKKYEVRFVLWRRRSPQLTAAMGVQLQFGLSPPH